MKIRVKLTSLFLVVLMLLSPFTTSYATTAAATNPTFVWDDETKDDAFTVFENTDWAKSQSSLIYDGLQNGSAKANVSDEVRALEEDVMGVLSDIGSGYDVAASYHYLGSLEYNKTDYTELILAMIQVLGEDAGVLQTSMAEEDSALSKLTDEFKEIFGLDGSFQNFTEQMGQYVIPGSNTGKRESIATIINVYSQSVRDYLIKAGKETNEPDNASYSEPYLFSNDASLGAVIEGVVMHYAGSGNYIANTYPIGCNTSSTKPYTEEKARAYYKKHQTDIDRFYSPLKDYFPSEDFAERVLNIYTVTTGNTGATASGNMQNYMSRVSAGANTAKVQAFLAELSKHDGKPYVWGASGPNSFDCSGLISYCLRKSGAIPNFGRQVSGWFPTHFRKISAAEAQPGDILWHPRHVMVYLENGYTFEAKGRKYGVGYFKRTTSDQTFLRWWN